MNPVSSEKRQSLLQFSKILNMILLSSLVIFIFSWPLMKQLPSHTKIVPATMRTDDGQSACEVVYAEALTVLQSANTIWHFLHLFSGWLLAVGILGKMTLFVTA